MRSRDHDVVVVGRTIDLRCWEFGMGREWGGDGKGKVSLRVTWGQGGQDRIKPKEGFQVSTREWEGSNRELARGVKQGDCAIIMLSICIHVYNNCLNV
jgi:hypothetical protein